VLRAVPRVCAHQPPSYANDLLATIHAHGQSAGHAVSALQSTTVANEDDEDDVGFFNAGVLVGPTQPPRQMQAFVEEQPRSTVVPQARKLSEAQYKTARDHKQGAVRTAAALKQSGAGGHFNRYTWPEASEEKKEMELPGPPVVVRVNNFASVRTKTVAFPSIPRDGVFNKGFFSKDRKQVIEAHKIPAYLEDAWEAEAPRKQKKKRKKRKSKVTPVLRNLSDANNKFQMGYFTAKQEQAIKSQKTPAWARDVPEHKRAAKRAIAVLVSGKKGMFNAGMLGETKEQEMKSREMPQELDELRTTKEEHAAAAERALARTNDSVSLSFSLGLQPLVFPSLVAGFVGCLSFSLSFG